MELIESLENSINALDSCLRVNEKYMTRIEEYQLQAETYAKFDNNRTSTLRPFGLERVGRPPVPLNADALKRRDFAAKFLQPMDLKPDWSFSETKTLTDALAIFSNTDYDWSSILDQCLSLNPEFKRSAISCEIQFMHVISKRPWTPLEDERLTRLVSDTKGRDWMGISRALGRTEFDCYSRCYLNLHPVLVPGDFSPEDDDKLRQICANPVSSWTSVAAEMGTGHTEVQCRTRWTKTLSPDIRCGRWNPQLDRKLLAAVAVYGPGKWKQISQHIVGKTDRKCRERWSEKFAPDLKSWREWDAEEDALLLSKLNSSFSWSKLSIPGRTDQQCRMRFLRIAPPELANQYRESLEKKRKKKLEKSRLTHS